MRSAAEYPVTFGYRAQDGYWYGAGGKIGLYHRGNDRPTPTGSPIIIGPHTIGWTGATGKVSGPHLHTQAMVPGTNQDVNPAPYEFKFGTVVEAGWHHQWGNYVRMRVSGVDIIYAHLSKINVRANQVISAPQPQGDNEVADRNQVNNIYKAVLFREGDENGLNAYTGRNANAVIADMLGSAERRAFESSLATIKAEHARQAGVIQSLNATIAQMQADEAAEDISEAEKSDRLEEARLKIEDLTAKLEKSQKKVDDVMSRTGPPVTPAVRTSKAPKWFLSILLYIFGRRK